MLASEVGADACEQMTESLAVRMQKWLKMFRLLDLTLKPVGATVGAAALARKIERGLHSATWKFTIFFL